MDVDAIAGELRSGGFVAIENSLSPAVRARLDDGCRESAAFAPAAQPGVSTGDPSREMEHFCTPRHGSGKKTQAVFFDGSARAITAKTLWGLKWHREWDQDYYTTAVAFPSWIRKDYVDVEE